MRISSSGIAFGLLACLLVRLLLVGLMRRALGWFCGWFRGLGFVQVRDIDLPEFLDLLQVRALLHFLHLVLYGVLEFIRRLLELGHGAADGFAQLRQFLRAEYEQGYDEDDQQFRESKTKHRFLL